MLMDLIGTSFCEVAIDEERFYMSGRGWMTRAENVRITTSELI
jgi:hypothetical protein